MGIPCHTRRLTILELIILSAAAPFVAAEAQDRIIDFDIPAGRLDRSLNRLAEQADIDVVLRSRKLAERQVGPIRGRMTARQALSRLLAGIDAAAVPLGAGGWKVEARPPARPVIPWKPPAAAANFQGPDIVVTASKQGALLRTYPGSANVIAAGRIGGAAVLGDTAVVNLLATIDSTHFGSGRNKLFIRGTSDSSFLGPLQATVGQYLGDVRLTYGVPDPDLQLVDIASVEVLEGPQGALYGSGSLGGIVRVIPNAPDLTQRTGRLSTGISSTLRGGPGFDAALTLNLPITDTVGVRLVGYSRLDGGYIDDIHRKTTDTNHVRTSGMRGTLRLVDNGWSADIGVIIQEISGADTAAISAQAAPLQRSARIAQPYDSRFAMASATVMRDWGSLHLISASSLSRQRLTQIFDSTGPLDATPSSVLEKGDTRTFSTETRLSGQSDGGMTWVAGLAFISQTASRRNRYAGGSEPPREARVTNGADDGAIFGEVTVPIVSQLKLTGGLRLSRSRLSGSAKSNGTLISGIQANNTQGEIDAPQRTEYRAIPSTGLFWQARPWLGLFGRYQEGFRAGGISERFGLVTRQPSDSVFLLEGGLRLKPSNRFGLEISFARLRWRDVQADVLTEGGNLVSQNIGTATIHSLEVKGSWRPNDDIELSGNLFLNGNKLHNPIVSTIIVAEDQKLPGVARFAASLTGGYRAGQVAGWDVTLGGGLRYFGKSELGSGALFGQSQGDYTDVELTMRIGDARRAFSLILSNPFNATGNQFAFSTPYRLFDAQTTPMRPTTLRIGFEAGF
jgi:iron complex outermembrane receptor protein